VLYLCFSSSSFLAALNLPADVCLEPSLVKLPLRDGVVLAEHVHQVGDVARRQSERLDLAQLRVGRNVGDAAAESRERRVDAVRPAPLLAVGADASLHHFTTASGNDLDRRRYVLVVGGAG